MSSQGNALKIYKLKTDFYFKPNPATGRGLTNPSQPEKAVLLQVVT